jgi:hypothetical protein
MKSLQRYLLEAAYEDLTPVTGDCVALELPLTDTLIESTVVEHQGDTFVLEMDERALELLSEAGVQLDEISMTAVSRRMSKGMTVKDDLSKHLEEEAGDSPVASAIIRRIMFQHPEVLSTHGPERVMQAADEVADWVGDVDEIGSSDVSAWTRDAIKALAELPDEPMNVVDKLGEAEYRGRKVPLGKPMAGDVKKSKVYVRKPNGNIVKVNFGDKKLSIKKHIPGRRKSFRARHNCANPGPRWKARYWSCRAW